MIRYCIDCYHLLAKRVCNSNLTEFGCPKCTLLWYYELDGIAAPYHNRGKVLFNGSE